MLANPVGADHVGPAYNGSHRCGRLPHSVIGACCPWHSDNVHACAPEEPSLLWKHQFRTEEHSNRYARHIVHLETGPLHVEPAAFLPSIFRRKEMLLMQEVVLPVNECERLVDKPSVNENRPR